MAFAEALAKRKSYRLLCTLSWYKAVACEQCPLLVIAQPFRLSHFAALSGLGGNRHRIARVCSISKHREQSVQDDSLITVHTELCNGRLVKSFDSLRSIIHRQRFDCRRLLKDARFQRGDYSWWTIGGSRNYCCIWSDSLSFSPTFNLKLVAVQLIDFILIGARSLELARSSKIEFDFCAI